MRDLESHVDDRDTDIESLKQTIENLRARYEKKLTDIKQRIAVYIPVKSDAIDSKLADYINNYPD